ncbi:PREDICTED: lymphocyte antigen 6H-like [Chrysochloris asiatica]|uniref:Lymphocyte antigen 6H-like n=1 Tax=Chrysochloris asiatica TaxID=185453 RepID=A0A9B0T3R8_CHRAS|nr:PREDICTED: lymphocyte antigen 6H-like [Chrysochloris asiatica]
MRGLCLLLLAALLHCPNQALALKCYTCTNPQDNSLCEAMSCPGDQQVCYIGVMTTANNKGDSQTISEKTTKLVKDIIPMGSIGLSSMDMKVSKCCDSDLCNGVALVRPQWTLSVGLLLLWTYM